MRCPVLARIVASLACAILATTVADGQRGRGNAPSSPSQQAVERVSAADQEKIRSLSLDLKQALLELNRLRQIPLSDPQAKNVPPLISAQSENVLKLAAAIYAIIESDGLAGAVVTQQQSAAALMANGLPPSERQTLADAGFSVQDIADLSVAIQLRGAFVLPRLVPTDQGKGIDTADRRMPVANVVTIGAGTLLIGFDIGSRFVPMVNAVTAFQVVGSVTSGMVLVAQGLEAQPGR